MAGDSNSNTFGPPLFVDAELSNVVAAAAAAATINQKLTEMWKHSVVCLKCVPRPITDMPRWSVARAFAPVWFLNSISGLQRGSLYFK